MDTSKSFAKSLFFGKILEDMVFPFPDTSKDEKETTCLMIDSFKAFAKDNIDVRKIDEEAHIPKEVFQGLGKMGLFGIAVPEAYGGNHISTTFYARLFEEVCYLDASLAVTLGGHSSIGLKGIVIFGTEEQKKKYLPNLASGKHMAAFALTEPSAGSDAAGIQTKAVLSEDGTHYILNGSKIWITNGGMAEVFTVFAKTEELDEKTQKKKWKITAFIVTREMGVKNGPEEHKLGIRGSSTTEIYFENVKVPVENVLGPKGKGFKVAMEILNNGRLGLAAGCVGGGKRAIKLARDHAVNRKQFQKPIAEFGMIQDKIANMVMDNYAAESMVYMTTSLVDRGVEDYSIESAICKVFASESVWRIVNESSQIAGGASFMRDYPYEQFLRDARINLIFEGTNEILRCYIALAGFQGPGLYLKEIGQALRYPIKGIGLLSELAVSRIKRDIVGLGDRITMANPLFKNDVSVIEGHVKDLARAVEKFLAKYKKQIWEKEFVQRRIANIVIDIYAMTCTISRTTMMIKADGPEKSDHAIQITKAFCQRAGRRVRRNFTSLYKNDDDCLKSIANRTYELGVYPFDIA